MAALKIGTRIKKVRGNYNLGTTGIVRRYRNDGMILIESTSGWISQRNIFKPIGSLGWDYPDRWEPIVPEGWKKVEWSDCDWQPEDQLVEIEQ